MHATLITPSLGWKFFFILILAGFLLPESSYGQRKRKYDNSIHVSTSFNFYPAYEPYALFNQYAVEHSDEILLNYITRTTGTFTVEEGETRNIERTHTTELPTPLIGIGGSVQIVTENGLFQEISLTRLSYVKSSNITKISIFINSDSILSYRSGFEQKAAAVGIRYEVGKYFGGRRRRVPNFRFGISGGLEPSYYTYQRIPEDFRDFPIKARLFTVEVSIIPMLSWQVSKKLFLEARAVPNLLLADFGSVKEERPDVPGRELEASREYNPPNISLAGSFVLRYVIKEPKRRKRK